MTILIGDIWTLLDEMGGQSIDSAFGELQDYQSTCKSQCPSKACLRLHRISCMYGDIGWCCSAAFHRARKTLSRAHLDGGPSGQLPTRG